MDSPDMEDTYRYPSALQYCIPPRGTPCPQGTHEIVTTCPVKQCEGKSGSVMTNFPGGPCCVPRVWGAVVVWVLPHGAVRSYGPRAVLPSLAANGTSVS